MFAALSAYWLEKIIHKVRGEHSIEKISEDM